jgi:Putative zinc-finger
VKLETLRTRSGDECLSDLQLDALALGVLDAAQARQAESHLSSCPRCSDRRQGLGEATRRSAEVLARSPRPLGSPTAATAARRSSRRVWLGGAMAAAAAAVLLLVIGRAPLLSDGRLPSEGDVVRTKGTSRVGFFVRHAGVVRRGSERGRVSPEDALRFVVTSTVPCYVAVLSRDGAGQVSVYHPSGPRAARVEAGVERPLDTSVVLDGVLGEERLYALTCSEPIELAALRDGLRQAGTEPAWPAQCSIDRFVLIKQEAKP